MGRDLSKTHISNMPEGDSKATIIGTHTGIEKMIEDISEIITTKLRVKKESKRHLGSSVSEAFNFWFGLRS